ncbi:hypothetical protein VTJ04DRAFT_8489 [Mycothermus thermophilus]|uniref:uncharacterized protein n=1 Tax=Humicola insolens TaxID=85995 RepID=UPI003743E42E
MKDTVIQKKGEVIYRYLLHRHAYDPVTSIFKLCSGCAHAALLWTINRPSTTHSRRPDYQTAAKTRPPVPWRIYISFLHPRSHASNGSSIISRGVAHVPIQT